MSAQPLFCVEVMMDLLSLCCDEERCVGREHKRGCVWLGGAGRVWWGARRASIMWALRAVRGGGGGGRRRRRAAMRALGASDEDLVIPG